jgi:hypothetical protein
LQVQQPWQVRSVCDVDRHHLTGEDLDPFASGLVMIEREVERVLGRDEPGASIRSAGHGGTLTARGVAP